MQEFFMDYGLWLLIALLVVIGLVFLLSGKGKSAAVEDPAPVAPPVAAEPIAEPAIAPLVAMAAASATAAREMFLITAVFMSVLCLCLERSSSDLQKIQFSAPR